MPQNSKNSSRFSFFGLPSAPSAYDGLNRDVDPPELRLEADKQVYRPGDLMTITIMIKNPSNISSLLIEKLSFECRGIQKLDSQWFNTPKPTHDSKQGRGEYIFMDCSTPTIVSNQIISRRDTKTYVIRSILPGVMPPSYKGTTIRYLYYARTMLFGQYLVLENGDSGGESIQEFPVVVVRVPLQIWITQKNNGENGEGIVPLTTALLDAYWKEKDADSEWAKLNEAFDGVEEGYESSRDEISSVSSYNPIKGGLNRAFGSSLSLQSFAVKSSTKGSLYLEGRPSISSNMVLPQLSVTETLDYPARERTSAVFSPSQSPKELKAPSTVDDSRLPSASGSIESGASDAVVRGRSYNIRLDNQVLLRFSPKNSDSTYYFSDTIGGTLTFFHEEGARRCLEMSITLESKESIDKQFVHPSRRHSPTITKIHSDHHEVVADLVQTSFLFSIPMDGPMTFSTGYISVQWTLRFEFFTTPKNVDWRRFEHPLLVDGREKCEWVLPITVHAPSSGTVVAQARNRNLISLDPLWNRT